MLNRRFWRSIREYGEWMLKARVVALSEPIDMTALGYTTRRASEHLANAIGWTSR
jgi:hypothetical protein